ncbi:GAP family protein [Streptomyces sp. NPDC047022]|uniref:GAP family protein n=1 Tax=Streptomyces sp. NPDC047022 TaxID=3155737 RepID=UPI0033EE173B
MIGQLVTAGIGIALSPVPVLVLFLLLTTSRGRANGLAFTTGWMAALTAVVTLLALAGDRPGAGSSHSGAGWVQRTVGVLALLLGAAHVLHGRRGGNGGHLPGWMRVFDRFTPTRSAVLAAVMLSADPKNLLFAADGALGAASRTTSGPVQYAGLAFLVFAGSSGLLLPMGVHLLGGERSTRYLARCRTWLSAHGTVTTSGVLVAVGAYFLVRSATG